MPLCVRCERATPNLVLTILRLHHKQEVVGKGNGLFTVGALQRSTCYPVQDDGLTIGVVSKIVVPEFPRTHIEKRLIEDLKGVDTLDHLHSRSEQDYLLGEVFRYVIQNTAFGFCLVIGYNGFGCVDG